MDSVRRPLLKQKFSISIKASPISSQKKLLRTVEMSETLLSWKVLFEAVGMPASTAGIGKGEGGEENLEEELVAC